MTISRRVLGAAAATVVVAGGASAVVVLGEGDRRREVAERGRQVMPFDLDATTHKFVKRPSGGLQIVVADRPDDRRQVELIREHLRSEARAFARGDFDDPAAIHGDQMPGLETLRNAGDDLSVEVQARRDGAQLTYRASDPGVVDALHAWFDAQVSDHGEHAERH